MSHPVVVFEGGQNTPKSKAEQMGKGSKPKNKPKKPTTKQPPWVGDHGTGTEAAMSNTELVPVEGENPNRVANRRRVNQVEKLKDKLSMRQYQAAMEIQRSHLKVETLSSGQPLKEQVDASPKPDATIAHQVDAMSHFTFVMKPVPSAMRDVVEHVCMKNLPMRSMGGGSRYYDRMADFKVALDLVANHLRY